jgi:hypothetical protein
MGDFYSQNLATRSRLNDSTASTFMNPLRRSLTPNARTPRLYGRPCVSSVRWLSSSPRTTSKILPTFSLQGKVSHAILLSLLNAETGLWGDRFAL